MPAIQKPGKPQSPVENLRLITLLSKFQYILATCLKKWIIPKIATETPPSQRAYRKYRTKTEHVLSTKLLTEKESHNIAKNTVYLLMLDMSEEFEKIQEIYVKNTWKVCHFWFCNSCTMIPKRIFSLNSKI